MTATPEKLAGPLDIRAMRQQVTVMRAQAEVLRRTADGLRDADCEAPADYVDAVAFSTEHGAELLNVFMETAEAEASYQPAPVTHCVCCWPDDCGDRSGHVRNDRHGEWQCHCGQPWPCERAS